MKCSVIIVTYNNEKCIKQCIDSVLSFLPGISVVVIDNASSDGTKALLHSYKDQIKVIENKKNVGFGAANNQGFNACEADFYLLLNPDAYLTNDILTDMFSFYNDPVQMAITGPALTYPDGSYQTSAYSFSSPLKWIIQDLFNHPWLNFLTKDLKAGKTMHFFSGVSFLKPYMRGLREHNSKPGLKKRESVDWITGACMLIADKVVIATGGFDRNIFLYGEDEELCFRAKKEGFAVERVHAGPVIHSCGYTQNRCSPQKQDSIYESQRYVLNKMYRKRPVKRQIMKMILALRYKKLKKQT